MLAHTHAKPEADSSQGCPSHRQKNQRRLAWALGLVVVYMGAEAIGGWLTGSLALLADAAHMLSDAAALGLALFASWITQRPPTLQRSFGYYRAEILAALANGAVLVAISMFVFVEAFKRFQDPSPVEGPWMLGIAFGGLVINLAGLWILQEGKSSSLNLHGAWLHVFSDMLGSVAAIVAGILIWAAEWNWADPAASVVIGILVIYSSWFLLKESVAVLMEMAPGHLDVDKIRLAMTEVPGVVKVEDLHVWTITSGMESLSAHVVTEEGTPPAIVLQAMRAMLHERFRIDHITIQIEPDGFCESKTPF